MKNIVFDLGGVVFARDIKKCTEDFVSFFQFVRAPKMPYFWEEYDRGTWTLDEVIDHLCTLNQCSREKCERYIQLSIDMQRPVAPTEALIRDLKQAGYKLYVLSNMSREFIDFLRQFDVYKLFDGEVVSCEEHTVKPEPEIYRILLDRYALDPHETLFIDDRQQNIDTAAQFSISGVVFNHADPEQTCAALRKMLL